MRKLNALFLCTVVLFLYTSVYGASITPVAKAELSFKVKMVMFKCGIENKDNALTTQSYYSKTASKPAKRPSASEGLKNVWHRAVYKYGENNAYVFAIVREDENTVWLALINFLLPLSSDEEAKYEKQIEYMKNEADYINGVKVRPVFEP